MSSGIESKNTIEILKLISEGSGSLHQIETHILTDLLLNQGIQVSQKTICSVLLDYKRIRNDIITRLMREA